MSADDFEKIIRNAIDKGVIPGCVVVATNKSGMHLSFTAIPMLEYPF